MDQSTKIQQASDYKTPFCKAQIAVWFSILMMCLINTGCANYPPITVKVVDAQSGEPIKGAVLLSEWTTTHFTGESVTSNYKTVEAISDIEGDVAIPGVYKAGVNRPTISVYKRGYVAWRSNYIFPDNRKRTGFLWYPGYVFKLERFKREYSIDNHQSFVDSVYSSAAPIGGAFRQALAGNPFLNQLNKHNLGYVAPHIQLRYMPGGTSRFLSSCYAGTNKHSDEQEIKRLIAHVIELCNNRVEPLLELLKVPSSNETLQNYLPEAISKTIGDWQIPNSVIDDRCASPREGYLLPYLSNGHNDFQCDQSRGISEQDTIGSFGSIATPILLAHLENADGWYRNSLILTLGMTRDPSIIEVLINEYNSDNARRKQAVIHAMGAFGDDRFTGLLLKAVANKDANTQNAAVQALLRINHKSVEIFVSGLQHETELVRDISYERLRQYSQPYSVATIAQLIELSTNPNPTLRKQAVALLGASQNQSMERVVTTIVEATKDRNPSVRKSAVRALGFKTATSAKDALIDIYREEDIELHDEAAKALVRFGIPSKILQNVHPQYW